MLSKVFTATLLGLDAKVVEVELDYRKGPNSFSIVGLADKSIQEARERIPAAIKHSGGEYVPMIIIANLAPAELHKSGPSYDLPLAIGYLLSSEQIKFNPNNKLFIGELALDGRLRPVNGILPIVDSAKKLGFTEFYLPYSNASEASLISGIKIFPANHLSEFILHFKKIKRIPEYTHQLEFKEETQYLLDLAQVRGQLQAKRALEIAAAGGHNILLRGTPGSGKTMLSKCLPSILPEMTFEESMEVTRIHSIAGLTSEISPLITARPFRSPHHTSSHVALVGGGSIPKPGEISLSHRGVLFLDEFPEFSNYALEALRQPLEDKVITISRASATLTFPASFILAAAMNPCKCGFLGDPDKECVCTAKDLARYQKKISGPILDRIDLLINVPKVARDELFSSKKSESSTQVQKRVQRARDIQTKRFKNLNIFSNSEMTQKEIEKFIVLDVPSRMILQKAISKMNLSARSYFRLLKVARTIADLELSEKVKQQHVAEALGYRMEVA